MESTVQSIIDEASRIRKGDKKKKDLWCVFAGSVAFWSTLALTTLTQQRLLGITTATTAPIPTLTGIAGVCVASLAAHETAIATYGYLDTGRIRSSSSYGRYGVLTGSYRGEESINLKYAKIPLHALRICCLGLLTFKLLGGRFWAVAPSSYTHLGSFSRRSMSIPATQKYATTAERSAMERMGRIAGCHTCGSHMLFRRGSFNFVGDHMPPKSVAEQINRRLHRRLLGWRVPFRFYPQCRDCSSIQGSILSKATYEMRQTKGRFFGRRKGLDLNDVPSYYHGWRPRINHLAGGVLGATAVINADKADILTGSRFRYARMHEQVEMLLRDYHQRIMMMWRYR